MTETQSSIFTASSGTKYFVEFSTSTSSAPGPTLFCLHGLGNSTNLFYPLVSALSPTNAIVRIDTPGHGRSPVAKKLSIPVFTADLHDIVTRFSPNTKPVIVGHSFGSLVALQYTAKYSAHTAGLILLGAGRAPGQVASLIERFTGLAARARTGTWQLVDAAVPLNVANNASPAVKAYIREVIAGTTGEGYAQVCEAVISEDHVDPDYTAILCPVMFLAGDKDVLSPVSKSEEIAALIKEGRNNCVDVRILSCGHQHAIEDFGGTVSGIKALLGKVRDS